MRPVLDNPDFQADLEATREAYLADPQGFVVADAILELRKKYSLSWGWVRWLGDYIVNGRSDPIFLHLGRVRIKEDDAGQKYAQLEIYFPLTRPVLSGLTDTLELKAGEYGFGYHEQEPGGGAPRGVRSETAEKYRALVKWYHGSWLTQEEFCREFNISRSKLSRAIKFVSEYGLSTD